MQIAKIKCDRIPYALPWGGHAGSNLRAFFGVPKDKDLYIQMEEGDDFLVEDSDEQYLVEDRDRFYTVFRKITGG